MDIWAWVTAEKKRARDAGNRRLAELIDKVPTLVCDEKHAQLDAAIPEALALARQQKSAWLEIFFRHWDLQSRVLHRHLVADAISDAVSLLEFSHRDDTKACPQSVCVVQDVVNCYGNIDGPGYVDERLAVTAEALAKIDATWPCFVCITGERASAMNDGGQSEEALVLVDRMGAELVAAGFGWRRKSSVATRASILVSLGRFEELFALVDERLATGDRDLDDGDRLRLRLYRTRALAELGRTREALADVPTLDDVLPTHQHYIRWVEMQRALIERGARSNDFRDDRALTGLSRELEARGVIRQALDIEVHRAELAIRRAEKRSAEHACARIEALIARLRSTREVPATLARLRAESGALPTREVEPFADVDALIAWAGGDRDAEHVLDGAYAAMGAWPLRDEPVAMAADALEALGRMAESEALLRSARAHDGGPSELGDRLIGLLCTGKRFDEALSRLLEQRDRAVALHDDAATAEALRRLVSVAQEARDSARAAGWLDALIALDPTDTRALGARARLQREGGDPAGALARLVRDSPSNAPPGLHDWERVVCATLLEDWAEARRASARLGFIPDDGGEGPIEEDLGLCRLQVPSLDDEHTHDELFAFRTSLTTARVAAIDAPPTIARNAGKQRFGDVHALLPTPLNAPPPADDPAAAEEHTSLYPSLRVLREGGFQTFAIEGVRPAETFFATLRTQLVAHGVRLSIRGGEKYLVNDPTVSPEAKVQGLYALIVVPDGADLHALHATLERVTAPLDHPLAWPELLHAMHDDAQRDAHVQRMARYGIAP